MSDMDLDNIDLGFVVNLQIFKEVLSQLSVAGRRWWIASDPQDAGERGYITIGHGDPGCEDRLNTVYFQIPVISSVVPRYQRARLVLLFDSSYVKAEAPGFYKEDGIIMQDGLEDFQSFFNPIQEALVARIRTGKE
jgi:hypothetical protein